jgi:hypothetical protein
MAKKVVYTVVVNLSDGTQEVLNPGFFLSYSRYVSTYKKAGVSVVKYVLIRELK